MIDCIDLRATTLGVNTHTILVIIVLPLRLHVRVTACRLEKKGANITRPRDHETIDTMKTMA